MARVDLHACHATRIVAPWSNSPFWSRLFPKRSASRCALALREATDEAIRRGVPTKAAFDFIIGHLNHRACDRVRHLPRGPVLGRRAARDRSSKAASSRRDGWTAYSRRVRLEVRQGHLQSTRSIGPQGQAVGSSEQAVIRRGTKSQEMAPAAQRQAVTAAPSRRAR